MLYLLSIVLKVEAKRRKQIAFLIDILPGVAASLYQFLIKLYIAFMEDPGRDIFYDSRMPLPNGTAVFVLGICSVLFSCLCIGLVLGIIGLLLSKEGRTLYKRSPHLYEGYGLLNAGFILSIIGIALGALSVIYFAMVFSFQAYFRSF